MTERSIALVTGAARGIGLASAQALAEDGFRVVLSDIDASGLEAAVAEMPEGSLTVPCDMGEADQVAALFERVEAEAGPVAVLVNNAGIAAPGDLLEITLEQFRKVVDVNLIGAFLALQRAAKTMVAEGIAGSIVNMSSVNAQVAIPSIPAYCATKGGIMQLTKATALALAPHRIRVNAVGPGSIDTAMMAGVNSDAEALKKVMSRTPLQRIGTPREVGDVVAFLASDKASYITGETIYVDGGRLGMNYTC